MWVHPKLRLQSQIVYVDNCSIGTDVWFDNVQVSHYSGQVLEEDHYYPFGLTLAQSSATNTSQPYKLTTKELESSFGLNTYDFGARQYDMQLGRWMSVDPLANLFHNASPFNYCNNNPITNIDPDGRRWLNQNDQIFANDLISQISIRLTEQRGLLSKAELKKAGLEQDLKDGNGKADKIQRRIDDLNGEIAESKDIIGDLENSSKELVAMGAEPNKDFTFKEYVGSVAYTQDINGVMTIGHNGSSANAIH